MTETTEKTNWVELVQLRAGAAVQILRQQKDDTALNFLRTLARQGFSLTVEGETLKVSPSSKITNKLRETLIKHKKGLVSLLSGPGRVTRLTGGVSGNWSGMSSGAGWRPRTIRR